MPSDDLCRGQCTGFKSGEIIPDDDVTVKLATGETR